VLLEQATAGQAFEKSLHEVTEQYKILEKDFQTEREGKLSLESRIKAFFSYFFQFFLF